MKIQLELSESVQILKTNQTLQTRLGVVEFDNSHIYSFARGLYGFEAFQHYIFAPLPGLAKDMNYMVLQSMEAPDLCFVVMKIDTTIPSLDFSNLKPFLDSVRLDISDVVIGVIVTFNPDKTNEERVTYNQKAPLVFSQRSNEGWQIILE